MSFYIDAERNGSLHIIGGCLEMLRDGVLAIRAKTSDSTLVCALLLA